MEYITIEKNVITGHFCRDEPEPKKGVEIMAVTNWYGVVGDDIRTYDTATWLKRPLKDLVADGLVSIPEKQKLSADGTEFVDMSDVELVEAGFRQLKPEEKIALGENGVKYITGKTQQELYSDGLISAEEYNLYIDRMRQSAYAAESDPLYMQVVRGDVTEDEWLEKITEIRERYPKV